MLLLLSQRLSVWLATPKNLIRRDYRISLYGIMTILPDDVIVMIRHNEGLMVTRKQI